jgi:hypothetical protein
MLIGSFCLMPVPLYKRKEETINCMTVLISILNRLTCLRGMHSLCAPFQRLRQTKYSDAWKEIVLLGEASRGTAEFTERARNTRRFIEGGSTRSRSRLTG